MRAENKIDEYYCHAWTLKKMLKKGKETRLTLPKFLQQEIGSPGIFVFLLGLN